MFSDEPFRNDQDGNRLVVSEGRGPDADDPLVLDPVVLTNTDPSASAGTQCSSKSIAIIPLVLSGREPETGATVFRHPRTHRDPVRQLLLVSGSLLDSLRRRPTNRIRMACKRSGVRIPIAPPRSKTIFANVSGPFGWRTAAKYSSVCVQCVLTLSYRQDLWVKIF